MSTTTVPIIGRKLTQTDLRRMRDGGQSNSAIRHRGTRTSAGQFSYPDRKRISFPYGDDRVSFWVRMTAVNKIYCASGVIHVGDQNATSFAGGSLTLSGTTTYVYIQVAKPGGSASLKQQTTLPTHTTTHWNFPLRKYTGTAGVYVEDHIYHFLDIHMDLPLRVG